MDFRDKMIAVQVRAVDRFMRLERNRDRLKANKAKSAKRYMEKVKAENRRVRKLAVRKRIRIFKKIVLGVVDEVVKD